MNNTLLEMFSEEVEKMSNREKICVNEIFRYAQQHDLAGNSKTIWRALQMLRMYSDTKTKKNVS
tara:strand:+ start:373 stop:564 length:192 start_codon:yes stop_codon:yes gene_type:complete